MPELGPRHHPEPEELLAYASGASEPWLSTLLACHLTLCPHCRRELAMLEELAGVMFDDYGDELEVHGVGRDTLDPLPLDRPLSAPRRPPRPRVPDELSRLIPRPLHSYFADAEPRFRFLAPGVKQIPLVAAEYGQPMRLVHFRPGYVVPKHGHSGREWALILQGELTDTATGDRYTRGDVSIRSTEDVHAQVIGDREPCVTVFANLGPIVPHTVFGRLLAKFVKV